MNDERKMYLAGLVYGQLPGKRILAGFIKHYVLEGKSLVHLQSDIALISWPVAAGETAKQVVRELERFVEQELPEIHAPEHIMSFAEMLNDGPAPENREEQHGKTVHT